MKSAGNYFKISQSWNVNGWYLWYWSLHQPTGHIYHTSHGYELLEDCIKDLNTNGVVWLEDLIK